MNTGVAVRSMQWPLVRSPVAPLPLVAVTLLCGNSPCFVTTYYIAAKPRPREARAEFSRQQQRPPTSDDWGTWLLLVQGGASAAANSLPWGAAAAAELGARCCCCTRWLRSREPPARQESALACRRATLLPTARVAYSERRQGGEKTVAQVIGALSLARAEKPPWGCVSEPPSAR